MIVSRLRASYGHVGQNREMPLRQRKYWLLLLHARVNVHANSFDEL